MKTLIYYPVKKDDPVSNALAKMELRPSLASQHLEYCLVLEDNRAMVTQRAFANTAILMHVAEDIIEQDPTASGALEEIMKAYLEATKDTIESYGKSHRR